MDTTGNGGRRDKINVGIADEKFDKKDCGVDNLRVLGKFRFADLQSVNHVPYKDDVLFIASGLGGLKIVIVQVNWTTTTN